LLELSYISNELHENVQVRTLIWYLQNHFMYHEENYDVILS